MTASPRGSRRSRSPSGARRARGGRRSARPRPRPAARRRPRRRRRRTREHVAARVAADPGAEDRRGAGDRPRAPPSAQRDARRSPSSASGAAMPRPSVTLWIMKPTIRNVPSVSSPTPNDVPMARPSPRLCRPMPTATSVASARPETAPFRRDVRAARRTSSSGSSSATPSSTRPGPPSVAGQRRLQLERLEQRLDAEERQQAGRQRHERGQPLRVGAPQRRQPEQAERDRQRRRRGSR